MAGIMGLVPHFTASALLGLGLVLCAVAFLVYALVANPKLVSRYYSSPSTPKDQSKASDGDFSRVFPPSQRALLSEVASDRQPARDPLASSGPILSIESDYRLASPSSYVFSRFTVGEVRALGDFPDYAKLSGVPLPSPVENFNMDRALPRPYRPFRWPYHQTMSLHKLDADYWLELESTYRERIRQRQALFAERGRDVLQALPGSELACKELMEMAVQFLCARYPRQFELVGRVLVNHVLGTRHDLGAAEPLHVLLDNVPEDFAITLRDEETGRYRLRAGIICSAIGWTLGEKMGLGLSAIHGPVPDYKERLAFSVDRFFTKMAASSPIQRASWGLEMGQPLHLPADDPDFGHRGSQKPDLRPEDVFLRVDWQTLRRLPLSGAVAFNFKALFTPLPELRDEPYIPSLVLKVLNEGKEGILRYKGTWHVEHVVKPALEEYERFQVEQGLVERRWSARTLDESPFFPGWERKHRLR